MSSGNPTVIVTSGSRVSVAGAWLDAGGGCCAARRAGGDSPATCPPACRHRSGWTGLPDWLRDRRGAPAFAAGDRDQSGLVAGLTGSKVGRYVDRVRCALTFPVCARCLPYSRSRSRPNEAGQQSAADSGESGVVDARRSSASAWTGTRVPVGPCWACRKQQDATGGSTWEETGVGAERAEHV